MKKQSYFPDTATPPGDTIRDVLEAERQIRTVADLLPSSCYKREDGEFLRLRLLSAVADLLKDLAIYAKETLDGEKKVP